MPAIYTSPSTPDRSPTICALPTGTWEGKETQDITHSLQSLKNRLNIKQGLLLTAFLVTLAAGAALLTLGGLAHSAPMILGAFVVLLSSDVLLIKTLKNTYQRVVLNKMIQDEDCKDFLEYKKINLNERNLLQVNDIYKKQQEFNTLLKLLHQTQEGEPSEDIDNFIQTYQIPSEIQNLSIIPHLQGLEQSINEKVDALA